MRVAVDCMILGERPSGVERAVSGLLRGLAQLAPDDLQVTALLSARRGEVPDCATISVSRGPWYTRSRAGRIFHEQAALGSLLRSAGMDVAHGAAYVLPLGWDGPSVVTIHDTITLSHPQWCKWANALHYREVMTRSALAADVVLTPSVPLSRISDSVMVRALSTPPIPRSVFPATSVRVISSSLLGY